jgi:hypothetical protein
VEDAGEDVGEKAGEKTVATGSEAEAPAGFGRAFVATGAEVDTRAEQVAVEDEVVEGAAEIAGANETEARVSRLGVESTTFRENSAESKPSHGVLH